MKVLNIYLTKIYKFMNSQNYFSDEDNFYGDSHILFKNFAQMLGYPEFGLEDGMKEQDFSYLPDSDLINYNDLDAKIFLSMPSDVIRYILKEMPDFYHQIYISLSLKEYSKTTISSLLNRLTVYLNHVNRKKDYSLPIQADYDFFKIVFNFLSTPSNFSYLLAEIEKSIVEGVHQWENFTNELLVFVFDAEMHRPFAARIVRAITMYEYDKSLNKTILEFPWENIISPKSLKSMNNNADTFIEITNSSIYFSVKNGDVRNEEVIQLIKESSYRLKIIFPEIDCFHIDTDSYFNRVVLHIHFTNFTDFKLKAMNTVFNSLIGIGDAIISVDDFNDKVLTPIELFINLSLNIDEKSILDCQIEKI